MGGGCNRVCPLMQPKLPKLPRVAAVACGPNCDPTHHVQFTAVSPPSRISSPQPTEPSPRSPEPAKPAKLTTKPTKPPKPPKPAKPPPPSSLPALPPSPSSPLKSRHRPPSAKAKVVPATSPLVPTTASVCLPPRLSVPALPPYNQMLPGPSFRPRLLSYYGSPRHASGDHIYIYIYGS